MHPPSSACRALYDLHKQLRLAWVGRPSKYADELNPGSFGVIQLYHVQDVGDLDDPFTFREFWHVTTAVDPFGVAERKRIDRGPLFSRNGSVKRDYDVHVRVPVFTMTLDAAYQYADGTPINTGDVFSGKFIAAIRHRLSPIVQRIRAKGKETARNAERRTEDLGREIGGYLWHTANKTGQTRDTSITIDQASAAMAKEERRWARSKSFEDIYVPPEPKKV